MSYQGNEILNLAFGHYSCHVVTNFFNIQEASFSYNPNFSTGIRHDVLFRENAKRNYSYSPRLIVIDDQSSLGYLSIEGYYKDRSDVNLNEECLPPSDVTKEDVWEKNDFLQDYFKEKQRLRSDAGGECSDFLLRSTYNLDENVKSWSDYLTTEFSDKTIVTIPRNTSYYESYDSFSCFQSGMSLWKDPRLCDDVEERIRFFLEECNNLQGFQVITDGHNGYAGLSSGCVELLRDEYSKKALYSMPAIYSTSTNEDYKKHVDKIYSLGSCFSMHSEFCDIVTPVSHLHNPWDKYPSARMFRNMNYKSDSMYQSSAIIAAALDMSSLPYRLQDKSTNMNSQAAYLNVYGRSFLSVGVNMPLAVAKNQQTLPSTEKFGGKFFESLTPLVDLNNDLIDIQTVTTKGLGKNYLGNLSKVDMGKLEAVEDSFKTYLYQMFPRVLTHLTTCKSVFRAPRTFPKILDRDFNLTDLDYDFGPLSEYITIGGLQSSKEMHNMLSNAYKEAKTVSRSRVPGFRPKDSDLDFNELFEQLDKVTEAYTERTYL